MLFGVFIIYQVYMLDPRRMVSVWFLDTSIWTKDRIFIYYPIRPFGHIPVSGIILEFDSIGYDITIFFDNITVFFLGILILLIGIAVYENNYFKTICNRNYSVTFKTFLLELMF